MDRYRWTQRLLMALLLVSVSSGLVGRTASAAGAPALTSERDAGLPLQQRPEGWAPSLPTTLAGVGAQSAVAWSQQAELTSTAETSNDGYGSAVAVSGDTAVIGAHDTPPWPSPAYGAAYIFMRMGSTWTQQAELTDPGADSGQDDRFGYSVAVQGDTAVIGAPGATGVTTATGVAYVYERTGSTWTLQATLAAADGAYNDGFGWSVALSGTTVMVGAPDKNNVAGAAYVFVRAGRTWSQQAELGYPGGAAYAEFGWAVAVSGDTAVVAAPQAPVAYAYVRSGTTWHEQATLHAPPHGYFGVSVAASGDTALVSTCQGQPRQNGAVYVFGRSGNTWALQATLAPPAGPPNNSFGDSIALSEHTAVVGGGPTYVYVGSGSAWHEQAQLIASDRAANAIGAAVAVQGNTALIGATGPPIPAAYVFVRTAG